MYGDDRLDAVSAKRVVLFRCAGEAHYRTFRKRANSNTPAYSPPALRILVAVSVAAVVNYHGNGIPTKPLTHSTFPQPTWQPSACDHRDDRQ